MRLLVAECRSGGEEPAGGAADRGLPVAEAQARAREPLPRDVADPATWSRIRPLCTTNDSTSGVT